jgi:hypothetical protein
MSGKYAIYQYRDQNKREIDFIIENDEGEIVLIEVKSSSSCQSSYFKHCQYFATNVAPNKVKQMIVLYTGQHVMKYGDNMWAIPISYLWSS